MSRPKCPSCGKSVNNTGPSRDQPHLCDDCREKRVAVVAAILARMNPVKGEQTSGNKA